MSSEFGPWFPAAYPGACAGCGDDIYPEDPIRADGEGGWLGECCGDGDGS